MNERIRRLLGDIRALEDELRGALHEQETRLHFHIDGKRVEFEAAIRERHRALRTGLLRWLAASSWRNLVSAPFIYAMIVPFLFFDLALTLYQATCFPLYRIARVRRADYIALDRQQLAYLNALERLNCTYCGYANGLIAYAQEIAARTEQYWCPIKHARKVLGTHGRYARFLRLRRRGRLPRRAGAAARRARGRERAAVAARGPGGRGYVKGRGRRL